MFGSKTVRVEVRERRDHIDVTVGSRGVCCGKGRVLWDLNKGVLLNFRAVTLRVKVGVEKFGSVKERSVECKAQRDSWNPSRSQKAYRNPSILATSFNCIE